MFTFSLFSCPCQGVHISVSLLHIGRAESAWRAVSLIFLVNGAFLATWAVNIPGVCDALSLSEAQIGGALLAIGLGALITMPLTGGWMACYGSGPVTRVAMVACMLSLALPFLSPNDLSVVLSLTVMGAANGSLDVAMNAQGVTVEQTLKRPVLTLMSCNVCILPKARLGRASLVGTNKAIEACPDALQPYRDIKGEFTSTAWRTWEPSLIQSGPPS